MSWQLAAFAIVAFALAAGFAWYERAKPDARIVALVATLAAFAALGRIAFAALPNVKPTTDIVLVSGYALGGAPGFAVGAIAGLTSNFFFGQGPWTPWQMVAWGATGIFGAGLATVTRNRIGRWPLAIVCAVVGYAFAAFQDVGDWVNYSDHSLTQLGVYVGKGTGFDIVHAAGCFAFALALGPALIRSVSRFSRRLQITWAPVAPALAVVAIAGALGALAAARPAAAASSPTTYLLSAQHRDGSFGSSPGAPSSTLYSGWAALGLAAAGHNPQDVARGSASLLGYIRRADGLGDVGALERTILVARASGVSARRFGGRDLIAKLDAAIRGDGSVQDLVNLTAFAVLALRSDGVAPPAKTVDWLIRQQDADGGFNFATRGGGSDVDDTGAALQALAGVGGSGPSAQRRAVAFIRAHQDHDGGFAAELGGLSNAQSSAWAVQGLLAAGVDPGSLHRRGAPSPLGYLRSLQAADGHIRYSRESDQTPVWVTAQAEMALARKPLPLAAVPRPHRRHRAHRSATSPSGTTSATAAERSANRPGAKAKGRRGASASAAATAGPSPALTAGAALLTALVLAPVGLG
jgi:energy-coupling factor transport system substrate-specific component